MIDTLASASEAARFRAIGLGVFVFLASACNSSDQLVSPQVPITETTDSTTPTPPDTAGVPIDSTAGEPADSTPGVPSDSSSSEPVDSSGSEPVDPLNPGSRDTCAVKALAVPKPAAEARGIAFGTFDMPARMLGARYTGVVTASGPYDVLCTLTEARRAGARILVRMSGGDRYFRNPDKTLNLAQWKARIDRFKRVNLQPYIADGTLLGHYILDEPHNQSTWGRSMVPYSTIEEMAKYSKQLWPDLVTVVRAYPDWLSKASFRWQHLDAAWAQYTSVKGEVKAWTKEQVSYAQNEGFGLIMGMNFLNGGDQTSGIRGSRQGKYAMSAKQIREWGAVLVADPHGCGFFAWKYDSEYFDRPDIKTALEQLSVNSTNRGGKSCKG